MSTTAANLQPIYGTGDFKGANSYKKEVGVFVSTIARLRFSWIVSCIAKEDKFIISAKMQSRYIFSDVQYLMITLEHNDEVIERQKFQLEKNHDQHVFEIAYDEKHAVPIKDLKVFASLQIRSMNYCLTDWATESDFKDSNRAHDVVLKVGETKFYVHRNYMATWSRYFDRLFFGDFKEKEQNEVKIEQVNAADMERLLCYMHPQLHYNIEEETVLKTLELADLFDIPNIVARCGTFLSNFDNCKHLSIMDRIEIGDKYNLPDLLISCFQCFHNLPAQDYQAFFVQNRNRIKKLSKMTMDNLI